MSNLLDRANGLLNQRWDPALIFQASVPIAEIPIETFDLVAYVSTI
jgi:hypothetical protein